MNRAIGNSLILWKDSEARKPLIIKGARQIGKSYSVENFGKSHFKNVVTVNFEVNKNLKSVFQSLDPIKICQAIAIELNQPIIPGETLLFLDEIQECSDAFLSLRYFYEKMPALHVICAGSLLDLTLDKNKDFRIPVGRIEYLYMFPLSFNEFLEALGETITLEAILNLTLKDKVPISAHKKLLSLFSQYILCGGMPAVVTAYINAPTDIRFRKIQADLVNTYKDDFRKYKTRIDFERLEYTFSRLPPFVAKNFKLNELCPDFSQATTNNIIDLFAKSKVIHIVKSTLANGIPLGAEVRSRNPKFIFIDIGLLNSFSDLSSEKIESWNHDLINSGALAEQVVGQEFLSYSKSLFDPSLYYWSRNEPSSSAEVDFVIAEGEDIIPIEVKAGSTGRLKSMRLFMKEKSSKIGVRISQHELSFHEGILSIPVYAISKVGDLFKEAKLM